MLKIERPLLVSCAAVVMCLGLLSVLQFFVIFLAGGASSLPQWYIISSLFLVIFGLFAISEIWDMKKRGLELLTFVLIVSWIIDISANMFQYASFFDFVILFILFMYYKKMVMPSFFKNK